MSLVSHRPLTKVFKRCPCLLIKLQNPPASFPNNNASIAHQHQITYRRQYHQRNSAMPSPPASPDFSIPIINIAPYLSSPSSSESQSIIDAVRTTCLTTGFFQITGHGVPPELRKSIFEAAANFFALPLEEKKKLDAKATVGHRGYDVLGTQSYEEGLMPDLKEVCSIYPIFPFSSHFQTKTVPSLPFFLSFSLSSSTAQEPLPLDQAHIT